MYQLQVTIHAVFTVAPAGVRAAHTSSGVKPSLFFVGDEGKKDCMDDDTGMLSVRQGVMWCGLNVSTCFFCVGWRGAPASSWEISELGKSTCRPINTITNIMGDYWINSN